MEGGRGKEGEKGTEERERRKEREDEKRDRGREIEGEREETEGGREREEKREERRRGEREREKGREREVLSSSLCPCSFSPPLCLLSAFTHLPLSSPLSLSLLSLSLSKSSVSPTEIFFTVFSLMLAPFRTRISTTSPFPLAAAACNGV